MKAIAFIGYVILGLFQTVAVIAGLEDWIGLHWIIAVPFAFFIAYIPVVGTVVGMFSAVIVWHCSWLYAGGLFFGPFVAILFITLMTHKFSKTGA